jgi:hypothetical protein
MKRNVKNILKITETSAGAAAKRLYLEPLSYVRDSSYISHRKDIATRKRVFVLGGW